MVIRRRFTGTATAQKPAPAIGGAGTSPTEHSRKRKRVETPRAFDKYLLDICGKLARLLRRTTPLHADIEDAYRAERFRSLPRPTIETLAVGLWAIDIADQSRKSKLSTKYRNKRRRLNYLISDGTKIVSVETAQKLRAELEGQPDALIEDKLDRLRTLLLIGFMHSAGDDRVLLRTWRPLAKILRLFFVVVEDREKLKEELHGADLDEAIAVALKNNIRGRVNYLARNFSSGEIPSLFPKRIFDQVYRTVRRALDS